MSAVEGTHPVMWDQLIQLSIPRTYIFGSRSLENYEEDRELQRRLEKHNIHIAIVPEAGHAMMTENPGGFARVIVEALESHV